MLISPQLERELREAAQRTLGTDGSRRRHRRRLAHPFGWVPAVAAVFASIVIAGVALTSLRAGGERSATPGRVPGETRLSAPLIASFAVLRRTQTPADIQPRLMPILSIAGLAPLGRYETYRCAGQRIVATPRVREIHLPGEYLRRQDYPEVDCQLMRVVRIPRWRARVVIAPTTFGPNPGSTARFQGMNLVLDDPVGGTTGTTGPGAGASGLGLVMKGGLNIFESGPRGTSHGIILIPDGVAKVTFTETRVLAKGSPPAIAGQSRKALSGLHLVATVRDNIAAFAFPEPTVTANESLLQPRSHSSRHSRPPATQRFELTGVNISGRETWLNAGGKVVRRSTVELNLLLRVRIT